MAEFEDLKEKLKLPLSLVHLLQLPCQLKNDPGILFSVCLPTHWNRNKRESLLTWKYHARNRTRRETEKPFDNAQHRC